MEINAKVREQGVTLVPTKVYFNKRGLVKVALSVTTLDRMPAF